MSATQEWAPALWPPLVVLAGWAPHPLANLLQVVLTMALALVAGHGVWHRLAAGDRPVPPRGLAPVLAGFLLALTWATVHADVPSKALWGSDERLNGALLYAACAVLLLVTATSGERGVRRVAVSWAVTAQCAAVYALSAWLGWSPWHEANPDSFGHVVFALFGNPDFAAAFLAISLGPAAWLVRATRGGARAAGAVGTACLVVAVVRTGTLQGPAVLLVVAAALGLGWASARRPRVLAYAGVLLACAAVVIAAALTLGPASWGRALAAQASLSERVADWTAAWRMTSAHPWTGVGPGLFDAHYGVHRATGPMHEFGWQFWSDAAHSVPLDLLAAGGAPLGLAHLCLVGLVAVHLVGGLRRLDSDRRALLVGCGAAWLGWQAQSLVSIDEPQLAAAHWLSSGLVLAVAASPGWVRAPESAWRPSIVRAGHTVLVLGLLVALTPVALYALEGDGSARALADTPGVRIARRIAPWRDLRLLAAADRAREAGRPHAAARGYEDALRVMPGNRQAALSLARLRARLGQHRQAAAAYERFLRLEPHAAEVALEYAELRVEALSDPAGAAALARRVLALPVVGERTRARARALCQAFACGTVP